MPLTSAYVPGASVCVGFVVMSVSSFGRCQFDRAGRRNSSVAQRRPPTERSTVFLFTDAQPQSDLRAAFAPCLPSAVRVDFGRWAIVRFSRAAAWAFLMF